MAIGLFWASISFCVLASIFIYDRMGGFQSKNHFPVDGRTVIVTGGSQGMGKAVAELLASKGANIIIVARNISKLEAALKDIRCHALHPSTQRFHFISADLTSPTEATRVLAESTIWNGNPPPIVFCCAGTSHPGHFLSLSPSILKEQMDVNYFSAAYIAHAAVQAWLLPPSTTLTTTTTTTTPPAALPPSPPRQPNHLIFTSSVLSFLPIVGYTPYTPPKIALRALAETLSQELLLYAPRTPIHTHTIYPGTIFSPGYEEETKLKPAITKKLEESDGGQSADEVARACIRGLERGEESVVTGLLGRAMRAGSLGGGKRRCADVVLSWVVGIVLVIVRRDLDGKVLKWGRENVGKEAEGRPQDKPVSG